MSEAQSPRIRGPLTSELKDIGSPVRQFLDERFTSGLRQIQRDYREHAPSLVVPPVSQAEANAGTIGTAADWLLRFLVHPAPEETLAVMGVRACRTIGLDLAPACVQIMDRLGGAGHEEIPRFDGPVPGNRADPDLLARSCWLLALLTEVYRGGPRVLENGPLGRIGTGAPRADGLLELAPAAALDQLSQFRHVFETALLPALATRPGLWAIGPTFTGSQLIAADADLIAGGLLLDLKTTSKLSLPVQDVFQIIGYALLDFTDQFGIREIGIFSARYAYLATWPIGALLDGLAGSKTDLRTTRAAFLRMLAKESPELIPARDG